MNRRFGVFSLKIWRFKIYLFGRFDGNLVCLIVFCGVGVVFFFLGGFFPIFSLVINFDKQQYNSRKGQQGDGSLESRK